MKTVIIIVIIICAVASVSGISIGVYFATKPKAHSKGSSKKDPKGSSKKDPKDSKKDSEPVDCETSEWTTCDNNCRGGTQTRTVTRDAKNGGESCGPLTRSCNSPHPCPVDCSVSDWSCDVPCVGKDGSTTKTVTGTQTRTVLTPSAYGGMTCPSPMSRTCTNTPLACPRPSTQLSDLGCGQNPDCTALAEKWYAYDPQEYRKHYICNGDSTNKCSYNRPGYYTPSSCAETCTNCDGNAACSSLS